MGRMRAGPAQRPPGRHPEGGSPSALVSTYPWAGGVHPAWLVAICHSPPHRRGGRHSQAGGSRGCFCGSQGGASDGPVSPCPQPRRCPGDQFPEAQTSRRGSWEQRGGTRECNSPVQPVHVGDADHLEEGEKDEVQGGGVAVEDLEPVAPGLQREAGGREEAGQAGRACTRTTRPLGRSPAALPAPRISSPVCPAPPPRALLPGAGGHQGWPERAVWGREGVSAPCT